jgi:hypothetical protein
VPIALHPVMRPPADYVARRREVLKQDRHRVGLGMRADGTDGPAPPVLATRPGVPAWKCGKGEE